MTVKLSISSRVRLAVSTALLAAGGAAHAQTTTSDAPGIILDAVSPVPLDEVVVTAEKRQEQLLSVPVPVTALEASQLLDFNQTRIEDFYSLVPGLQLAPFVQQGAPQVAIRGIVGGQGTNPTVGITIDGVPFGSSVGQSGGSAAPDVDPSDLARVEVLRGPQGTLYGANTLGGLLQYVTIDPSTSEFSGRVQAGVNEVQNGAEPGYNFRASVNLPVNDTFAVRASFFTRQDGGYIDDPTFNLTGVNKTDVYGGRLAALWQPTSDLSVKFAALFQRDEAFGLPYASYVDPAAFDLTKLQTSNVPGVGADTRLQNESLTVDYKFGTFDLTSISSYNESHKHFRSDVSATLGPLVNYYVAGSNPYFEGYADVATRKWTEEVRLSTPIGSHVNWLFGVFYTKENSKYDVTVYSTDASLQNLQLEQTAPFPQTFEEYAAFTDFTFKITDRFDIQVGGRESQNRQVATQSYDTYNSVYALYQALGAAYGQANYPTTVPPSRSTSKDNSFTYLLTPRWTFVADGATTAMLYARFASGYRPGGPNAIGPGVPVTFGPDKTKNYDLGLKADLFDRNLFLDLSLYYVDWTNIQVSEATSIYAFYANGNSAKSEGVELQTEWRPIRGLTIKINGTYDDAVLTKDLPAAVASYGLSGTQLPYTPKWTGNLTASQEFPLGAGLQGFVGGEFSYLAQRYSLFATSATADRQVYPAYALANLRAGVKWKAWTANIYATNIANRRAELAGGLGEQPTTNWLFITPRTIGIDFMNTF